jgi:hypothetical protein
MDWGGWERRSRGDLAIELLAEGRAKLRRAFMRLESVEAKGLEPSNLLTARSLALEKHGLAR